jgi:hypothetical protein
MTRRNSVILRLAQRAEGSRIYRGDRAISLNRDKARSRDPSPSARLGMTTRIEEMK